MTLLNPKVAAWLVHIYTGTGGIVGIRPRAARVPTVMDSRSSGRPPPLRHLCGATARVVDQAHGTAHNRWHDRRILAANID